MCGKRLNLPPKTYISHYGELIKEKGQTAKAYRVINRLITTHPSKFTVLPASENLHEIVGWLSRFTQQAAND